MRDLINGVKTLYEKTRRKMHELKHRHKTRYTAIDEGPYGDAGLPRYILQQKQNFDMKEINILCFGDSLTAGYHSSGPPFHPYAVFMKHQLQRQFPLTKFNVRVDGVPGDKVCPPGTYIRRMVLQCKCIPTLPATISHIVHLHDSFARMSITCNGAIHLQ